MVCICTAGRLSVAISAGSANGVAVVVMGLRFLAKSPRTTIKMGMLHNAMT
jgi:hypothetical protein